MILDFRQRYSAFAYFMFVGGLLMFGAMAAESASANMEVGGTQDSVNDSSRSTDSTRRGMGATYENEWDILDRVASLGEEAAQRLKGGDFGEMTQQIQRQILDEIDRLLRGSSQRSTSQATQQATERDSQQASEQARREAAQETQTRQGSEASKDSLGSASRNGSDRDLQQALSEIWGQLPARERPPVAEQFFETIVPRYRSLIEAYYRELARARREPFQRASVPGARPNP